MTHKKSVRPKYNSDYSTVLIQVTTYSVISHKLQHSTCTCCRTIQYMTMEQKLYHVELHMKIPAIKRKQI